MATAHGPTLPQSTKAMFSASLLILFIASSARGVAGAEEPCASMKISRESLNKPCDTNSGYVDVELDKKLTFTCGEWKALQEVSSSNTPKVSFKKAQKEDLYTLLMLDPNAPNHGDKFWLHWLVTDIKGEDLANGDLKNARTVTGYFPPKPPAGTGDHHYQFFVFVQPSAFGGSFSSPPRSQFDAVEFVTKFGLCELVGATQFVTGHD